MPEQMAAVQALPAVFAYDFGEKEKYRTDAYYDEVCHGIDLAMLSCKPMDKAAFAELCAPLHRQGRGACSGHNGRSRANVVRTGKNRGKDYPNGRGK